VKGLVFGIDKDAVFNVFGAVALGKEQFAILDDRDGGTGYVVFLHRRCKKIIKKGFQLDGIGRTLCGCWRDRHIATRHDRVWLCHGWRDNRQQHRKSHHDYRISPETREGEEAIRSIIIQLRPPHIRPHHWSGHWRTPTDQPDPSE
jgi:hypothetical protein